MGDGRLPHPGPEQIIEAYYSLPTGIWKAAFDYQFIANPAYNRDRGPASTIGTRAAPSLSSILRQGGALRDYWATRARTAAAACAVLRFAIVGSRKGASASGFHTARALACRALPPIRQLHRQWMNVARAWTRVLNDDSGGESVRNLPVFPLY